ncbi:MAG TPA: hypothetical protein VGK74_22750, partial [Symbiobacteriaceae bacterium]
MERRDWRRWFQFMLLAAGAFVVLLTLLPPAPAKAATGQQRVVEINVKARQWAFTPGVIEVNQGDLVRLKITSEDV